MLPTLVDVPRTALQRLAHSRLRYVLWPLSLIYGAAVRLRHLAYDLQLLPTFGAGLPTLSVGGVEAGGSGKTPVVAWLLQFLLQRGEVPGLLTRGHGRSSRGLVVCPRGMPAAADQVGDEAAMLRAAGLDVAVAACTRRLQGAQALRALGCTVLVLDDGFSHRALQRHLDIVVLRRDAPQGAHGLLLPAGSLREPVSSLRRAQVIWMSGPAPVGAACPGDPEASGTYGASGPPGANEPAEVLGPPQMQQQQQMEVPPSACCVESRLRIEGAFDLLGRRRSLRGVKLLAVAGIALPELFYSTLLAAGADIVEFRVFSDHHRYSQGQGKELSAWLQHSCAAAIITTAKDAIKLQAVWPQSELLWVLRTSVELISGQANLEELVVSTLNRTAIK
jgi:tetraacyldisaccharide 4'-kinase